MPEVVFHTGITEPVGYACRLLRKARRQGVRVGVCAAMPLLQRLDQALWTFEERDFLPHVRLPEQSPSTLARTPIWLGREMANLPNAPTVWINLGADLPEDMGVMQRLDRVIEVVSTDGQAEQAARVRWRQYAAIGHPPTLLKGSN